MGEKEGSSRGGCQVFSESKREKRRLGRRQKGFSEKFATWESLWKEVILKKRSHSQLPVRLIQFWGVVWYRERWWWTLKHLTINLIREPPRAYTRWVRKVGMQIRGYYAVMRITSYIISAPNFDINFPNSPPSTSKLCVLTGNTSTHAGRFLC